MRFYRNIYYSNLSTSAKTPLLVDRISKTNNFIKTIERKIIEMFIQKSCWSGLHWHRGGLYPNLFVEYEWTDEELAKVANK